MLFCFLLQCVCTALNLNAVRWTAVHFPTLQSSLLHSTAALSPSLKHITSLKLTLQYCPEVKHAQPYCRILEKRLFPFSPRIQAFQVTPILIQFFLFIQQSLKYSPNIMLIGIEIFWDP